MAQDTTAVDEQWEIFRPQAWRKGAHKGERKMLYGILDPGETMECLIGGAFGPDMEKAKFGKTFHSAIGVATDRRVIFVDKGLFGSTEVREMPCTSVDAITCSTGMFLAGLRITGRGILGVRMEMIAKSEIKTFVDCVRSHLLPHAGYDNADPRQMDNLDQLLKLNELLQAGILTQEEFDTRKAQLLGSP